jgi:hypothetical protein
MHEFGYTFEEIHNMTPEQIIFLQAGLQRKADEEKKQLRKARRRRR